MADGTKNQGKKMDFKNILDIRLLFQIFPVTLHCFHQSYILYPTIHPPLLFFDQPLQPLAMEVLNMEFKDTQEYNIKRFLDLDGKRVTSLFSLTSN